MGGVAGPRAKLNVIPFFLFDKLPTFYIAFDMFEVEKTVGELSHFVTFVIIVPCSNDRLQSLKRDGVIF